MRGEMPGNLGLKKADEEFATAPSPKKFKRRMLKPSLASAAPILQEVDDTEERTTRNLNRIMEQATKFSSPQGTPERRKSIVSNAGMTNLQIVEHYSNCLKLSAENKITLKNAFDLHLIDLMGPVLNKEEETNFQAAGSTIDASAKIYAYRVDCLYKETYKIAGGLGRSDKAGDNDDEPAQTSGDQAPAAKEAPKSPEQKKRRKKHVKGSSIETNERALNMVASEAKFETDELFENVKASFEEGNASGLFSNTLCTLSDNSRLILHSLCDIPIAHKLSPLLIECKKLKEILNNAESAFNMATTCPPLANFTFRKMKDGFDEEESLLGEKDISTSKSKEFAAKNIDLSVVADTLNAPTCSSPQLEYERAEVEMLNDSIETVDDKCGHTFFDLQPSVNKSKSKFGSPMRPPSRGSPSPYQTADYSSFLPDKLQTWMGPDHWKVKKVKTESGESEPNSPQPLNDDLSIAKRKSKKVSSRKRRLPAKRKVDERVNFDQEVDFLKIFKSGRASTVLSNATLAKYKDLENAFEPDVEMELREFSGLFLKPGCKITKSSQSPNRSLNETLQEYNLDNPLDEQNFCPDSPKLPLNDQDGLEISFADAEDDPLGGPPDTVDPNLTLNEHSLIEQPYKVNKIDIDYAKQAKRIDVRQLKNTLWQIITAKDDGKSKTSLGPTDIPTRMSKEVSFSKVWEELPSRVSPHLASNLTAHTMFTVLLHMCNEKNLSLEGNEEFSDVKIAQD